MRSLVTGAAGFLGSHLVDRLLSEGHDVVGVDNLITGSYQNIEHLRSEVRFRLVEEDVAAGISDVGKVDAVFHFASPASPVDFVPKALPILRVGSLGTFNALDYADKCGAWFLMASTSEVYGDPLVHPQREDYLGNVNPIGVRGVYDESKRFSEAVTSAYRRTRGLNASIVRIFNTYGPRMRLDDGRVIPNFVSQALRGEPLTMHGGGKQTRSFCYVDDLIDGIWRFFETKPTEPINLGNDREMSMQSMAEAILRLTGSKSYMIETPLPPGDPKQRCPDLTRAKAVLGFQPKTDLDTGLKKTIDYFRSVL